MLGCCSCRLFSCALKFYSPWWWFCIPRKLVGVKYAVSIIIEHFPFVTLLGSWWVVKVVGAHMCGGCEQLVWHGWMEVKVVGVWLGWLRCSCGVLDFTFDGKVGWWLLALECVV